MHHQIQGSSNCQRKVEQDNYKEGFFFPMVKMEIEMAGETYFPWQTLHLWPAPTHTCFVSYLRSFGLALPAQEASPAESEVYF